MQSSGECIVIIVGENIIDTSIFKEIFLKIINTIKFNVRIVDVEYQGRRKEVVTQVTMVMVGTKT